VGGRRRLGDIRFEVRLKGGLWENLWGVQGVWHLLGSQTVEDVFSGVMARGCTIMSPISSVYFIRGISVA
jgi:hypothetical protein